MPHDDSSNGQHGDANLSPHLHQASIHHELGKQENTGGTGNKGNDKMKNQVCCLSAFAGFSLQYSSGTVYEMGMHWSKDSGMLMR